MTTCARCQSPLTTSDLRWYFDGRAEAAMGVRSSHEGFEAMLNAGPPTGYRNGDGAENHVARAIDSGATARHRCIRTHKLGQVPAHHLEVLRVAYDGQDWTRLLDEQVGRGPRVELQRLFPHEQLQVALLTPTVRRTLDPDHVDLESATPVYASPESTLASLRRILGLKDKATTEHAAKKLAKVMRWARGKAVRFDGAPIVEQLRILVGHTSISTPEEKIGVVRASRRLLAQSERVERTVRFTVKAKVDRTPTTPQSLLVSLLSKKGRKTLARIRSEAEILLQEARRVARVIDPEVARGERRRFSSPGPTRSLHATLAATPYG